MRHLNSVLCFLVIFAVFVAGCGGSQPAEPSKPTAELAVEIMDHETQRNDMHSCPVGMFVTGVHVANNILLCKGGYGDYSESDEYVDKSTQGSDAYGANTSQNFNMHSCKYGYAVTGIHAADNLLSCAPFDEGAVSYGKAGWAPWFDDNSQRQGMHACPDERPVLGIHIGNNDLMCIGRGFE